MAKINDLDIAFGAFGPNDKRDIIGILRGENPMFFNEPSGSSIKDDELLKIRSYKPIGTFEMKLQEILKNVEGDTPRDRQNWIFKNVARPYDLDMKVDHVDERPRRIMLAQRPSTLFKNRNFVRENPYRNVVIDCNTWKIVSYGSPMIHDYTYSMKKQSISKFKLQRMYDSTVVTLYPWTTDYGESCWEIMTSRSWGIGSLYWTSEFTYAEAFNTAAPDLFKESVGLSVIKHDLPKDDWTRVNYAPFGENIVTTSYHLMADGLDRNYCYSFLMRFHDFQPLKSDPQTVIFLEKRSLIDDEISYDPPSGLDTPQDLSDDDIKKIIGVEGDGGSVTVTIKDLIEFNTKSWEDHLSTLHYGFIVTDSDGLKYNLNSSLMDEIKKIVYEHKDQSIIKKIDPEYRREYIELRSILSSNEHSSVKKLFPHWANTMTKYQKYFESLVEQILYMRRREQEKKKILTPSEFHELAYALMQDLSKFTEVDGFNDDSAGIVKDLLFVGHNTMSLMTGFYRYYCIRG